MTRKTALILSAFYIAFCVGRLFAEDHDHEHDHSREQTDSTEGQGDHDEHAGHDKHHEEGALILSDETLKKHGISFEEAGPASIAGLLRLNGRVSANQDKVAHIHPRFPGIVKGVFKKVGDVVEKGEILAAIESNQSLNRYEIPSLISGTVLFRHATVGEYVTESEPIFVIADLTSVWIDLFVYPKDFEKIRNGQRVRFSLPHSNRIVESTISLLSRVVDERTQAKIARAVVENEDGLLYPDLYLDGAVTLEEAQVPLAIKSSAIQRVGENSIVFVKADGALKPREVMTGRTDGVMTEILRGVSAGAKYALGETFILKAELGKSTAEHEH